MTGEIRIGLGHDTHRIAQGGTLRLGGVNIEAGIHLVGHSDADVLLHAITDCLLGAANLGDIGQLFPDTDPIHRGRDSAEMLRTARDQVVEAGWTVINIDCVVLAEQPRLLPWKKAIQQRIADILEIDVDRIGLKGKTGEKSGLIGTGQIMQAICSGLLQRQRRDETRT